LEAVLDNGARVDIYTRKVTLKHVQIYLSHIIFACCYEHEGFQFAGSGAENGASVASVWKKRGLRMELG
jgi:hypothetical protein